MRIKRMNGLKVGAITIALLLCLALAVGITGAWYQAKRQATGTLSMDQGIIIDYNGFDKTGDEWSKWERTATLPLFSITDAQPGEQIAVNAAGIRANEKSVNFYARVKLSYKFYNGETSLYDSNATTGNVANFKPSDLITTSGNFFGDNWVESADGYYYYGTGTTLNKFEKGAAATTPFVNLFATDAKFVIEGAGFTGADNDGESGGFKIDDTTSINKIEVYLTLETLQGDADVAVEGWKIAASVRFAEATGKMETSVNKTETTEDLNVSVAGATEVPINEVVFPYDTSTTLKFDSNNVEYITLTYDKDGVISTETFEETALNTITVKADSSKGKVTGYTVGTWSSSEYKDFTYSNKTAYEEDPAGDILAYKPMESGICLTGYFGDETALTIPLSVRVRERDFKILIEGYSTVDEIAYLVAPKLGSLKYPCTLNGTTLNSMRDLSDILDSITQMTDEEFIAAYPKMEFEFKTLCVTSSILYSKQDVKEIDCAALAGAQITSVTIPGNIEFIDYGAFFDCLNLETVILEEGVKTIGKNAFYRCSNLKSITISNSVTSIGDDAFNRCISLTSVTIGSGVTSIGRDAFWECSGLTSIKIPDSVTSIGDFAFNRCISLTSVTIGSGVTSIGNNAFSGCSSLESVTIGSGVTSIGKYAFQNCRGLTSIKIPNSVTSIGDRAFINCSSLKTVSIDSATIAGLRSSYSDLLYNATTVYVKSDITTVGSYITGSYTKAETSDKAGYDMYTKNA